MHNTALGKLGLWDCAGLNVTRFNGTNGNCTYQLAYKLRSQSNQQWNRYTGTLVVHNSLNMLISITACKPVEHLILWQ